MVRLKISLLILLVSVGYLYAIDEYKYISDYEMLTSSEKVELLDIINEDNNSRLFSTQTTNYIFLEIQKTDSNKDRLNELEESGKLKVHKIQKRLEKNGGKYIEQEDVEPLPDDFYPYEVQGSTP